MQRTKAPGIQNRLRAKPKKDGSRRYDEGIFPSYDEVYNRKRKNTLSSGSKLSGIGNCQVRIIELTGNEDGYYKLDGNWRKALIPSAKEELKRVRVKFKRWQTEQIKKGKALKAPSRWPDDLLQQRLKAEALVDIYRWEKSKAEQKIQQLKAGQQTEHENNILPHGPQGRIGFNRAETKIVEADGQNVSYSPSGLPYISEAKSPYDGMPVATYRQMCKDWKKEMGITLGQLRDYREELFKQERKKAILADEQPPERRLPVTHSKVPFWMEKLGITKDVWPDWPDDAKPISEIESEAQAEGS